MRYKLPGRNLPLWLCVAGGLLLAAALLFWCYKTSTDPERVFWRTIERGLSSQGVTVQSEQSDNGTAIKQIVRYSHGASNLAHAITTFSQQGTTVQNEMIGTPDTDYYRHLKVETDQTRSDGSPIDFSNVLGVWAVSEGTGQLFEQALLGSSLPVGILGVPIGNLSAEARDNLVAQIRKDNVYHVALDTVKKERKNGRLQYTYEVNVQPVAYVALMKRFMQEVGLHGLDRLDPKAYEGQPAFRLEVTVDALANEVVRISAQDTGDSQTYSGYGVPVQVRPPEKTVTNEELQQRLSELQ